MAKTKQTVAKVTEDGIIDKIHIIRSVKVMLDKDLAEMYGVKVKRLNEAVKRNVNRFPQDFMFQLSSEEANAARSQIAALNNPRGSNIKYLPYAFTEQGVAMLSSILNSETAIAVNIQIIRVFTQMKQALLDNKELFLKIEKIEKKLTQHDEEIQTVFKVLKKLLEPKPVVRKEIGFPYPNKK
jgi:hypothetical protein